MEKLGVYDLFMPLRNNRKLLRASVKDGWAMCPVCGAKLCRVYYGAKAQGIELYCKGRCAKPVLLDLS